MNKFKNIVNYNRKRFSKLFFYSLYGKINDLKFTKKLIKDIKNKASIIRSGGGMSVWKNFNKIGIAFTSSHNYLYK